MNNIVGCAVDSEAPSSTSPHPHLPPTKSIFLLIFSLTHGTHKKVILIFYSGAPSSMSKKRAIKENETFFHIKFHFFLILESTFSSSSIKLNRERKREH
jgi:hypothetical protein